MKKQYTKEEKAAYFADLRKRWKEISESITPDVETQIKAIMKERGLNFSVKSWVMVEQQMRALGLEGLPYVDTKTFLGWKDSGFVVKKGERSKIMGITWINLNEKEENEDKVDIKNDYVFPKVYHLFHNSQVEPIAA
jgi:hypothetical protein